MGDSFDQVVDLDQRAFQHFLNGDVEAALATIDAALEVRPDMLVLAVRRAVYLFILGRMYEARHMFRARLETTGGASELGSLLGLAVSHLERLYPSQAALESARSDYELLISHFAQLIHQAGPAQLAPIVHARCLVDLKTFYLAYQGACVVEPQRLYGSSVARIMAAAYPEWSRPLLRAAHRDGDHRIRVGFATSFLGHHSVTKSHGGWITELDQDRFAIHVYNLGELADHTTMRIAALADVYRAGLVQTADWAAAIQRDGLDALVYLDIGMHGREVELAGLRLAPVQATTWGHPVTSGMPTIDLYLSSAAMEPANADDHYTETLIRLPSLSVHYEPFGAAVPMARAQLRLSDDDVVFMCCQSLWKYIPQYDDVFARISAQLPQSRFLFIKDDAQGITDVFADRIGACFSGLGIDPNRHLVFLDKVPPDKFGSLVATADVFLDSIGWSGFNSTLEALAAGLVPVTMAMDQMRGRHGVGILCEIACDALIAMTVDDYVALAVRIGGDQSLRDRLRAQIKASLAALWRDKRPVRALEAVLSERVGAVPTG